MCRTHCPEDPAQFSVKLKLARIFSTYRVISSDIVELGNSADDWHLSSQFDVGIYQVNSKQRSPKD